MPLPTRSVCSAVASPGGQISSAGAVERVEEPAASEAPSDAVCLIVDGVEVERSSLGGITIDMMSVGAGAAANVALGPEATPVMLGVALPVALVEPVPFVTVAVVAVVMGRDTIA